MITKRSNAEIADQLAGIMHGCLARGWMQEHEAQILIEACTALREPITFSDASVEAAAKAYADTLPAFGNENYFAMLKSARAALEAAIAVHNKERE